MDYWTSGPDWQRLATDLVAAEQQGTGGRSSRPARPEQHPRPGLRALARALVTLAARLDPAMVPTLQPRPPLVPGTPRAGPHTAV